MRTGVVSVFPRGVEPRSGLAISTINQKFRARYGVSPMRYLQRVEPRRPPDVTRE